MKRWKQIALIGSLVGVIVAGVAGLAYVQVAKNKENVAKTNFVLKFTENLNKSIPTVFVKSNNNTFLNENVISTVSINANLPATYTYQWMYSTSASAYNDAATNSAWTVLSAVNETKAKTSSINVYTAISQTQYVWADFANLPLYLVCRIYADVNGTIYTYYSNVATFYYAKIINESTLPNLVPTNYNDKQFLTNWTTYYGELTAPAKIAVSLATFLYNVSTAELNELFLSGSQNWTFTLTGFQITDANAANNSYDLTADYTFSGDNATGDGGNETTANFTLTANNLTFTPNLQAFNVSVNNLLQPETYLGFNVSYSSLIVNFKNWAVIANIQNTFTVGAMIYQANNKNYTIESIFGKSGNQFNLITENSFLTLTPIIGNNLII